MNKPKILIYDVETRPNLGFCWGKWEQNILHFVKEWELLSVAYKFVGDKTVKCVTAEGQKDDLSVVKKLHSLFNEADILIAHNGDSFDQKKSKARMLFHGLKPTKPLVSIDTKKVAKAYFNFTSNSLADLGSFLKLGSKLKHTGFDMWLGCMEGDKKSWALMTKYNKQDVVLLEKVYKRFLPWIERHPSIARMLNHTHKNGVCPTCASEDTEKRGFRATQATVRQQWTCHSCGRWFMTAIDKKRKGN